MKVAKNTLNRNKGLNNLYAVKVNAVLKALFKEHLAFLSLCIYFFFEYVRPQSIYPALQIIPWAQIALITTIIAVFLDRSTRWVSLTINKILILYLTIIIVSVVFAFNPMSSLNNASLIINWVVVYYLVILIVNSEKRMFIFLLAYLLFNFKMSQHGFFSWAKRGFSYENWGLIGAGGYFSNSGEFAIQMLIFGTLSMSFVLALRNKWGRYKKIFFYFMPFSAFMTVMGASSRGAQLALAAIAVLVFVRIRGSVKGLIVLMMLIFTLLSFLSEEQIQRFSDIGDDRTSLQRIAYWKYGFRIMNENPFTGIGYYNWYHYIIVHKPEELGIGIEEPHNIFVKVGVELGYPGLLCYLMLIFHVFKINSGTRCNAKNLNNYFYQYISYGLDAGLVGFIVAGLFVSVTYYPFFWVQMAMSSALYSISCKQIIEKNINSPNELS